MFSKLQCAVPSPLVLLSLSVGGHVSAHASLSHQHFQLSTSHPKLCVTSIRPCLCAPITFSTQSLLWGGEEGGGGRAGEGGRVLLWPPALTLPNHFPRAILSPRCSIVIMPTVEPLTGPRPDLTARAANHPLTSISSHATGRHSFGPWSSPTAQGLLYPHQARAANLTLMLNHRQARLYLCQQTAHSKRSPPKKYNPKKDTRHRRTLAQPIICRIDSQKVPPY